MISLGLVHREFYSQEDKIVRPKKNKIKVKAMEFSTVRHQGKSLKMMGELASTCRPKTRPRNKLRLNMKKLLNHRLNTKEVTVLDNDSSDEKPLKIVEESSLTETKLSAIFLELRGEMLKEQQKKETEVSYSEDKLLIDEIAPTEIVN